MPLAASFHSRLRESAHPNDTEDSVHGGDETQPLLEPATGLASCRANAPASAPASTADQAETVAVPPISAAAGTAAAIGKGCTAVDIAERNSLKEEIDQDGTGEEEERPRIRSYDFVAMARRMKQLLPYLAPLGSRLVQALVGEQARDWRFVATAAKAR